MLDDHKKMLKIGLVYSNQVNLSPYIQKICLRNRCSFGVTGLQYEPFDIIIIPDGIGVYVGLAALAGMSLPDMPLCQYAEYFRIHLLQKYIDKDIPVIGIGEGAAMICPPPFKVGIANGKTIFLRDDKMVDTFEVANLFGAHSPEDNLVHEIIKQTVRDAEKELKAIKDDPNDIVFEGPVLSS